MTTYTKRILTKRLNQANLDIWSKIRIAYDTKNWALMAKNLSRLYALQAEYVKRLNIAEIELKGLENELISEASQNSELEKQFLLDVAKRTGNLDLVNARLEEIFGK